MRPWMVVVLQLNGDGLAPGANHQIRFTEENRVLIDFGPFDWSRPSDKLTNAFATHGMQGFLVHISY